MRNRVALFGFVFLSLLTAGCGTPPPIVEVSLPPQDISVPVRDGQKSRLVMFNDSGKVLYGVDTSGKINVYINSKAVGQLNIGEYLVAEVEKGAVEIKLLRSDLLDFRSTDSIEVSDGYTFVRLRATPVSNRVEIVAKPAGFENEYKAAYK
jgi:hypothetical protein